MADPLRIQQVADNLLLNAAQLSNGHAQIDIVAECHDDVVVISVVDHGFSIPKAFLDRVFKIFAQATPWPIRQHGAGSLGLTVAKAIVEAHHGKIGVSSVEGRGTTFYFDLALTVAPGLQPEIR